MNRCRVLHYMGGGQVQQKDGDAANDGGTPATRRPPPLSNTLPGTVETVRIGALYVALLLAGDWASTPVRLFLIRTFGLQVAMLMMTPLIIALAFFAARWALERLGPARTFSQRLVL